MDFITDRVAIGSSTDALLKKNELGFTATLNVAADLHMPEPESLRVERHKAGLVDGPGNNPHVMSAAVHLLQGLLGRHERVLVHCHSGMSRSPTVVAAWLAWSGKQTSFGAAATAIKKARSVTTIHPELRRLAEMFLSSDHY